MEELQLCLADPTGCLQEREITSMMEENADLLEKVKEGEAQYKNSLGWLRVSEWAGQEWLNHYQELAQEVRQKADVLVVIGIGGSNQAARAVIDAIEEKSNVHIIWAGNTISAYSISKVLKELDGKSVYINVIAKNFETLEPGIGFRALRVWLRGQYGESYAQRVICTGTQGSHLEELSREHGFTFLPFPEDIGGRFTALSPIGLFPMAVAGMNIQAMAAGAADMEKRLKTEDATENVALRYAAIRNLLYRKGYRMEMLSFFEPRFFRFAKWWMQLFGESEGKDNKGLYPLFGNFSEDLHSIGQFLQDGSPIIYELFLEVRDTGAAYILRKDDVDDRFDYLNGRDFNEINQAACEATIEAHSQKYPCLRLSVPAIDERSFGMLFYFFEFTCYLSARILGVNPFDQPGVEDYKKNMFRTLGK